MEEQTNQIYENSGYTNEKNDVQQNNVPPKDYKILAIITTIINFAYCNPMGLIVGGIAIYFANQVSREYKQGNHSRALSKSNNAKNLSNIAFGMSLGFIIAGIFYMIKEYNSGSCR